MTRPTAALLALTLVMTAACDGQHEVAPGGSITVKLPPPRPALSTPGFSFARSKKPRG